MNSARLKVFCSQEETLHNVSIQKAKTFFAVTSLQFRKRKKENLPQVQNKTLGAHLYEKEKEKKMHILILNVRNIPIILLYLSANHFKMHSTYRMPTDISIW